MAMSATIALTESTVLINQTVHAVATISNSGGSDVLVISFQPQAQLTGSPIPEYNAGLAVSSPAIGAGQNVTVPAGGSLKLACQYIFFSPSTGPIGAGSNTYDCGALIQTNDGSIFAPTPATVTVNPLPLPSTEQ